MSVDIIFKIAGIGILLAVICQILKKSDRDDIATLVALAGLSLCLLQRRWNGIWPDFPGDLL